MKRAVAAGADVYVVDIAVVEAAEATSDFQKLLKAVPPELQELLKCAQPRWPLSSTVTPAPATAATAPAIAATATPTYCTAMASLRVLAFDHEGRPVQFHTWLDDLQLYLLSDSKDSVSLFDLVSGAATAPPATADSSTRSPWLTRDAAARLAIRNHLPLAECAHFGQHRTAQALGAPPPALLPPTPLLLLQTSQFLRTLGLLLLVRSAVAARARVVVVAEAVVEAGISSGGGGGGGSGGGSGGSGGGGGGSGGSGGSGGGGTGDGGTGVQRVGSGGGQY
ncbi:unnamed protein product [Closterium sp. NIES-54]